MKAVYPSKHAKPTRPPDQPSPTRRSLRKILTPWLMIVGILFVIEFAVMYVLPLLGLEGGWENAVDSLMLGLLVVPVLYMIGFSFGRAGEAGSLGESNRVERCMWVTLTALVGVVLTVVCVYALLASGQQDNGRVINLAGQERMLSQRIVRGAMGESMESAHAKIAGREAKKSASIAEACARFERILHGLLKGDAELGLPSCPSEKAAGQLKVVDAAWHRLRALVRQTRAPSNMDGASAYFVALAEAGDRVLAETDRAVTLLQEHYERRANLLNAVLASAIAAATVIVLWLAVTVRKVMLHRKEVEAEVAWRATITEAVNRVLHEALTCDTEEDLGRTCLRVAEGLTGSKFGFLGFLNSKGLFDVTAISNPGWDACKIPEGQATLVVRDMPIQGIDRTTMRDGESRTVNDMASHPDRVGVPEGHPPVHCFLGVPLKEGERTIGMIGLGNKKGGYIVSDQEAAEALSVAVVEAFRRKWAEAALRESREYADNIIRSLIDMLVVVAPDGRIVTVNDATCKLLGYPKEELIGQPAGLLFPEEEDEEEEEPLQSMVSEGTLPFKRTVLRRLVQHGFVNHLEAWYRAKDGRAIPVLLSGSVMRNGGDKIQGIVCVAQDITDRKRAEAELAQMNTALRQTSRQAGMAEVAANVLHNVGNVLTAVNVSAATVAEIVHRSRLPGLARAAELVSGHADDLADFIANDEKGTHLPGYLSKLAEHLAGEQATILEELESLTSDIEHINNIILSQQGRIGAPGVVEPVNVADVLDDVLRLSASSNERRRIEVVRDYGEVPPAVVDRHKLLQVLVNLVTNAKHALVEGGEAEKRLTVKIGTGGEQRVRVEVSDNGVGIPKEVLTTVFSHGFTTRKDGHGFGLHSAALAAREMSGSLAAYSDGPGRGATFTLELPTQPAEGQR